MRRTVSRGRKRSRRALRIEPLESREMLAGDVTKVNFSADQFIGQEQNVDVATGINVAFADHLKSVVKPSQDAANTINFG